MPVWLLFCYSTIQPPCEMPFVAPIRPPAVSQNDKEFPWWYCCHLLKHCLTKITYAYTHIRIFPYRMVSILGSSIPFGCFFATRWDLTPQLILPIHWTRNTSLKVHPVQAHSCRFWYVRIYNEGHEERQGDPCPHWTEMLIVEVDSHWLMILSRIHWIVKRPTFSESAIFSAVPWFF